jgi:hypothetical protein
MSEFCIAASLAATGAGFLFHGLTDGGLGKTAINLALQNESRDTNEIQIKAKKKKKT